MEMDTEIDKPNVKYFRFEKDETPDQMAEIIGKELLLNYAYVQSSLNIETGKRETLVAFDIRRFRTT